MTLNKLEVTKCCKNKIILFSLIFSLEYSKFKFLFYFLELFLDEHAMVRQYIKTNRNEIQSLNLQ
jgi:hypothetical protein